MKRCLTFMLLFPLALSLAGDRSRRLGSHADSTWVVVGADTLEPLFNSTVFMRNFTVDTVTVQRVFETKHTTLIDSLSQWSRDADVITIDASKNADFISATDEGVKIFAVDSTGNLSASNITANETLGTDLNTAMQSWVAVTGWTYASSKWSHATGQTTALTTTVTPVTLTWYKAVITIAASVAGTGMVPTIGGKTFASIYTAGTYTYYFKTQSAVVLVFTPGAGGTWVGDITAVSIKPFTKGIFTGVDLALSNKATMNKLNVRDSVMVGNETTTDQVIPVFSMKGDADSDAGALTSETIGLTLVGAATPTNAYWYWTSTQAANGYRFDKEVSTADSVIADKGLMFDTIIRSKGGNAGGTNSVNLSTARSAATMVASGNYSTLGGGRDNTASATNSTATGGYANTASGTNATIGGGSTNVASGNSSTVIGGSTNTASGTYSTVGGYATLSSRYGQNSYSSGPFAVQGDAQYSSFMLYDTTLSSQVDTPKLNGIDNSILGKLVIDINSSNYFEGEVVGRCISANFFNQEVCYKIEGGITRNATTGTTLDWVTTPVVKFEGTNLTGCTCVVAVNDTDDQLAILVSGVTATTIRWVCYLRWTHVGGATL